MFGRKLLRDCELRVIDSICRIYTTKIGENIPYIVVKRWKA